MLVPLQWSVGGNVSGVKLVRKQTKLRRLRNAIKAGIWYAACEDGHPFWSGPDRKKYSQADQDAKSHDKRKHSDGEAHAVVLSS
jgi:hypothetical protein